MDPAMMEQYADWLDDLEKSDPKAYGQFIQDMQAKMHAAGGGDDPSAAIAAAMPTSVPDQLKFPGNKVMQRNGIEEQKEGMYVDVTPGFVMKTTEQQSKTKLFVNICSSDHIQIFSKKKQLDEHGDEQEGIHVPLSLGPPHEVVDHAQKTCLAVDVAVNPGVLDDCNNDATFRHFVCELALQYLAEKYKFVCDPQYKLPKLSYRGTLPPSRHYIRKTQAPVIQEVSAAPSAIIPPPKELQTPTWRLFHGHSDQEECMIVPACEGGPLPTRDRLAAAPAMLTAVIEFPSTSFHSGLKTSDAMDIQLNAEYVVIAAAGYHDVARFLPYPIQVDAAVASVAGSKLTLVLPVDKAWTPTTTRADSTLNQNIVVCLHVIKADTNTMYIYIYIYIDGRLYFKVHEDETLPEDRFHQRDMMSMHILDQRRRDKAQQAAKSAADRASRKADNEKKQAAARAAGKTWAEMYPTEPETTFVDLNDLLAKSNSTDGAPVSEAADAVANQWKQQANKHMQLKSSLAFELLE
ncbi:hypothetical protein H257_16295 [Aphanomyces astaci]|uniref:PIH1 N-terminal domain-containing protein n=1 Tax=Aphanomyces astaci TaxID=112090 RepID=W4FL31_APHAT|nr:hypothetical protein H257_16295 [Aphanomyces astaci]ETV67566.1 hypothetical protein H257_16295 [Aphanomyces astaci]|eukprot:XP_009842970.1 hypothetical protein H257_16295 [Aphanomyces astaci]